MNENLVLRDYGNENNLNIDGRNIPYRLAGACDYLLAKNENWSMNDLDNFRESNEEICTLLEQIIGLKQACILFRCTSYSDGRTSDSLFDLKCRLINELEENYNYKFDESFYNSYSKNM